MWLSWAKVNVRLQQRSEPHDTIEQTCIHHLSGCHTAIDYTQAGPQPADVFLGVQNVCIIVTYRFT